MRGTEHSRDTSKHLVLCDEDPRVSQHCSTHRCYARQRTFFMYWSTVGWLDNRASSAEPRSSSTTGVAATNHTQGVRTPGAGGCPEHSASIPSTYQAS